MHLLPLRQAWPIGASEISGGWNFVVFSAQAHAVDLCLFDEHDHSKEIARIRLPHRSGDLWHGAISGIEAGQPYGLRVHGPWAPNEGKWFNPNKLLLDPYARAVSGEVLGHSSQHTAQWHANDGGYFTPHEKDSAEVVPRSILAPLPPPVSSQELPCLDEVDLVIYEAHVKGFSQLAPYLPEELRGTFAGLAHENSLAYLKNLGITAVQLMPIHLRVDDLFLRDQGLSNYWGYQSINFFTPDPRLCASSEPLEQIHEFRNMVKALHDAGMEVILDVVYNHSGEHGAGGGFSLSFRGLDSNAYYRQPYGKARYDQDFTGTGNSLDTSHPRCLQMVMDSLRYWVNNMGVDGFRFDLAATLGRDPAGSFTRQAALFKAIAQDPVLARARMIAEPWDIGPFGYQVGGFPTPWYELNGKYRDSSRRFWKGEPGTLGDFAARLTGSRDYYGSRTPQNSVNFITSHDGFTLRDLVSYHDKQNLANGEENRDGESHNLSWNSGAEGETTDEAINALRRRRQRNMLATLFLSQGTPFLLMGDERNRSQGGNNNGYAQDNKDFWLHWNEDENAQNLREFTSDVIKLRQKHIAFRRRRFLHGGILSGNEVRDARWYNAQGQFMSQHEWNNPETHSVALLLAGIPSTSKHNWRKQSQDPSFLLLFSADHLEHDFTLPGETGQVQWQLLVDTAQEKANFAAKNQQFAAGQSMKLLAHHLLVFIQTSGAQAQAQQQAPLAL